MIDFIEVDTPKPTLGMDLVRMYTTSNSVQAHLLRQRLNDEGIDATVVGDFIEQGQPLPSCIEILVPKAQAKATEKMLQGWKVRTDQPEGLEPFSVYTTATFLFISVSLIAFLAASPATATTWIPWGAAAIVGVLTLFWVKRQFGSEIKLKQS